MGGNYMVDMILAGLALFFCYRLWLVLGRHDGETPPSSLRDPFAKSGAISTPARIDPAIPVKDTVTTIHSVNDDAMSLEASVGKIKTIDTSFEEKSFLTGAKEAFSVIVKAFAAGDRQTLRPLLADDVYASFDRAIAGREAARQTLETKISKIDADLEDASLTGTNAPTYSWLPFNSNQPVA